VETDTLFSGYRKFKERDLFEIEIFCNIIHIFTVTFDQFNASLLNKSINFFKKKIILTSNVSTILYNS